MGREREGVHGEDWYSDDENGKGDWTAVRKTRKRGGGKIKKDTGRKRKVCGVVDEHTLAFYCYDSIFEQRGLLIRDAGSDCTWLGWADTLVVWLCFLFASALVCLCVEI